jgi:hypothetical protein
MSVFVDGELTNPSRYRSIAGVWPAMSVVFPGLSSLRKQSIKEMIIAPQRPRFCTSRSVIFLLPRQRPRCKVYHSNLVGAIARERWGVQYAVYQIGNRAEAGKGAFRQACPRSSTTPRRAPERGQRTLRAAATMYPSALSRPQRSILDPTRQKFSSSPSCT